MTCQLLFLGSPLFLVAAAQGLAMKYDWFEKLKKPLDLGLTLRGRRLFGDHKTWRGFFVNVLFCILGSAVQTWLVLAHSIPGWLPMVDYGRHGLLAGFMLGVGMTLGELPNSFFKRQLAIPPGGKRRGITGAILFLLDQMDLAVGIWLCLFFLVKPTPAMVLLSLPLTLILHAAVSTAGYFLKMRETMV